jgi:hypothetical protein
VHFIGELFKKSMLGERIMHCCLEQMLGMPNGAKPAEVKSGKAPALATVPDDEDLEAACKLFTVVGKHLDDFEKVRAAVRADGGAASRITSHYIVEMRPKVETKVDRYFKQMMVLQQDTRVSSRIRFLILDVIEHHWIRHESEKMKTISRAPDGNAGDRGDAGDAGGEGGVAPAVDMAKLVEDAKKAEQELLASLEADESSKKKKGGKKKKKKGGGGAAKGGGDDAANEGDAKPAAVVEVCLMDDSKPAAVGPELPEVDGGMVEVLDSDDEEARAQRLESHPIRQIQQWIQRQLANDLVLTGSRLSLYSSTPPPALASANSLDFGSAKSFDPPPQATPMPPQPPAAAATAKPAAKSPPPAAAASASASAKSDPTLLDLLTDLGLQQHLPKFEAEEIDMETLEVCEPEELSTLLEELKLTMGPRKKIQKHFAALHAGAARARPLKTVDDVDSLNAQMDAAALRQEALERELHAQTAELTAHRNECERLRDTMRARGVVPRLFECPICMEVMYDPVSAADGHTYERGEMERWLEMNKTSPSTGAQLENLTLTPNYLVRSLIREYMDSMRAAERAVA